MRKIVISLLSIVIILLSTIIILSSRKNINIQLKVYSIPTTTSIKYVEDKRLFFDIYLNEKDNIISYEEKNEYSILSDSKVIILENVNIEKQYNCSIENEKIYRYQIFFDIMPYQSENLLMENCYLNIKNELFSISVYIGNLYIYTKDYKSLDYYDLYGNYSYYDNGLFLVGISIGLNSGYHSLENVIIPRGYGVLDYVKKDHIYDSEINNYELIHSLINEKQSNNVVLLDAKSSFYFIPISYQDYYLTKTTAIMFKIDGELYLLEDFTYLITETILTDYLFMAKTGDIIYA